MAWVPALSSIWDLKSANAESRKAVESCRPLTIDGPIQLDRDPDVTQILLLSDAFGIDELVALQLVQRGYFQVCGPSRQADRGRSLCVSACARAPTLLACTLHARWEKYLPRQAEASCWRM